MDLELFLRVAFCILWLVFLCDMAWVPTRVKVKVTRQQLTQGNMPLLCAVIVDVDALLLVGWTILYAVQPSWIVFTSIPLPSWLRLVSVITATFGLAVASWGYRAIGSNWVDSSETNQFIQRKDNILVVTGPYRYTRNPIYLGMSIMVVALGLVAANWVLLVSGVVLIPMLINVVSNEEKMLVARFGDEYRDYMKRTPRFIPKLRRM